MENGMTMGLFDNEIDFAFQANPDFGLYDQNFLFAGLGNPISGTGTFNELDAFDTTLTTPLSLGYFMAGSLPISIFTSVDFTDLINRSIAQDYSTTVAGAPVAVLSGTTTTNHNWIAQTTAYTPSGKILFRSYDADIQALTRLGPATTGIYVNLTANDSAADTAVANGYNTTIVDTYSYNTAAAGVAPTIATNYSTTKVAVNYNPADIATVTAGDTGIYSVSNTLRFGIPFAMRTGDIEHQAYLDATFGGANASGSYSLVETAHADPAALGANPTNDRSLSITSETTSNTFVLNYQIKLPAGENEDRWFAGLNADIGTNGKNDYAYDYLRRPYDLSVVAVKTALAGGFHEVSTETYKSVMDFSIALSGGRIFAFQPASAITFKFAPTLSLGVSSNSNSNAAYVTSSSYYSQDLNATGAYDATTYTRTDTTVSGDPSKSVALSTTASLPMGLVVMPESWKFGFIMGASPTAMVVSTTNSTSTLVTTTTTTDYTGDTVSATDISISTVSPVQKTSSLVTTFSEEHYIGITIPLDGGVRFDARLNGNLLTFETFTIQALIPLGN